MERQINRFPSLDGLRAISVTLVILDHYLNSSGYEISSFVSGNLGVRIFFVISGFLITSILNTEFKKTSTIHLKKFYFRRTLRIFPAYYFFIFVIFILNAAGIYQINNINFLFPITYTSNYLLSGVWELGHCWSLSVEEQFYLLFPGIFLVLGNIKTKKFLFFILLIAPLIRISNIYNLQTADGFDIPEWFKFGFHTNMDALASGCLLALGREFLHKNKFYESFLHSKLVFLLLLSAIIFVSANHFYIIFFFGIGLTVINLSICLCIDWLIINHESIFGRLLNSAPLVFIGTMSYSIYLWQQLFTKYSEDKLWTHFPVNIILIALFSFFSYYVTEKTFLDFRQKAESSVFPQTQNKDINQTSLAVKI